VQHEVHDEVSLEMGCRLAARLREQPALLQIARDNLARWVRQNADAPALVRCYREWLAILERPLDDICQILCADTDEGRRLRQNSPFAGVLPTSEVWSIKAANPGASRELLMTLAGLATNDVPLLHVCGSIDPLLGKNSTAIEGRYKELGGPISVMIRDGEGHYPLGPKDPKPVLDFIIGIAN